MCFETYFLKFSTGAAVRKQLARATGAPEQARRRRKMTPPTHRIKVKDAPTLTAR
jgi:hypothetical protein